MGHVCNYLVIGVYVCYSVTWESQLPEMAAELEKDAVNRGVLSKNLGLTERLWFYPENKSFRKHLLITIFLYREGYFNTVFAYFVFIV